MHGTFDARKQALLIGIFACFAKAASLRASICLVGSLSTRNAIIARPGIARIAKARGGACQRISTRSTTIAADRSGGIRIGSRRALCAYCRSRRRLVLARLARGTLSSWTREPGDAATLYAASRGVRIGRAIWCVATHNNRSTIRTGAPKQINVYNVRISTNMNEQS